MILPVVAVPWIIGGLSAAAGALGIKKGVDAKKNYARARDIVAEAQSDFENAKGRLEKTKTKVSKSLADLGKLRLEVETKQMKRFVDVVKQVNQASYKPITLGATSALVSLPELKEMETSCYQAADLMKDGIGAVSTGVLVGVGASGLASSIGVVAGTGTAIGSLTGVAATNATLAWLGGGSLAASGMGMAGGAAILGGAIAGPALAVMGFAAASKSEKALTEAYEQESEIRLIIEQVENGTALLTSIRERSEEMRAVISDLMTRFSSVLDVCEQMIEEKHQAKLAIQTEWEEAGAVKKVFRRLKGQKPDDPLDFTNFSQEDKDRYTILNLFGVALYRMIKVQVLDDEGLVTSESDQAVAEARTLLREK